jgi:hypothetical protein
MLAARVGLVVGAVWRCALVGLLSGQQATRVAPMRIEKITSTRTATRRVHKPMP